jgi:hypothetical protein
MLQQVLEELKAAKGPVSLDALAHKLGVERSALEGMIQFWIRKGRIKDDILESESPHDVCDSVCSTSSCSGPKDCAFVMSMPRTYSLKLDDSQ